MATIRPSFNSIDRWHSSFTDTKAELTQIRIAQGQAYLFQEGGMPFGLGNGLAQTIVNAAAEPQVILKRK